MKIHWTLVIISLLVTPICLLEANVFGDPGHDYRLSMILFPYGMLSAFISFSLLLFIPLAVLQFPLYGLILGSASYKGRLGMTAIKILLWHAVVSGGLFLILRS